MPAYRRLSQATIDAIRVAVASGSRIRSVARHLRVDPKTVRYWLRRQRARAPRNAPQRPERQRRATQARRAIVRRLAGKKRVVKHRVCRAYTGSTAIRDVLLRDYGIVCAASTVRRDLRAMNFRYRVRGKTMAFTAAEIQARAAFARRYGRLNPRRFVFTDEKTFTCGDYSNNYEWVPPNGQPTEKDRSSTAQDTVYVWGAIGWNFRHLVILRTTEQRVRAGQRRRGEDRDDSERFNGDSYKTKCLQGAVMNHLKSTPGGGILQADGHRAHYCQTVVRYLDRQRVQYTADWPARSPDLNPIENLWAHMQREVSALAPLDAEELKDAIWTVWHKMPNSFTNNYVESFKGKCKTVVENGGRMTK